MRATRAASTGVSAADGPGARARKVAPRNAGMILDIDRSCSFPTLVSLGGPALADPHIIDEPAW